LNNPEISCIEWDSTFKVAKPYVLCIPMAIYRNVGVPLGFIIGSSENSKLYEHFYDEACSTIGKNINNIPCLSDFGLALKSFCERKSIEQFYCQRHLFQLLGNNNPIHPVINVLTKCISEKSLALSFIACSSFILKLIEFGVKQSSINETLKKIGLSFIDGAIVYSNEELFKHCSLLHRIDKGIPTTTNHVESTHGHLNSNTPRRKGLFSILNRLITSLIRKTKAIDQCYKRNLSKQIHELNVLLNISGNELLQKERLFYETTHNECMCGKSFQSSLYGIKIQCIHQITSGENIPVISSITNPFSITDSVPSFIVHFTDGEEFVNSKTIFKNAKMAIHKNQKAYNSLTE